MLATGTGAPVALGTVLVQYTAVTWTGESAGTTWPGDDPATSGTGPQELPVATDGPFAGLVGVPLGSRVLVQVPGPDRPVDRSAVTGHRRRCRSAPADVDQRLTDRVRGPGHRRVARSVAWRQTAVSGTAG